MAEKSGSAITLDAIVRTAVELMTERGLEAMTLRRIATELGISAPTLYWYISSKRDLLDHVAEHLLRRGRTAAFDQPAPGQPWWEWLRLRTRQMYDQMVAVRDAPQVVAGNRPKLVTLSEIDTALGVMVSAGFPAGEAQQVFFTLGGYVGGMALEAQSEAARVTEVDDAELIEAAHNLQQYPNVARALRARRGASRNATFDYGLGLIIAGVRVRHEELTSPAGGERASLGEPGS